MKYLSLIWKLIFWNIVCFVGFIIGFSFFCGEPAITLMGAFTIAPVFGTVIGIIKYYKQSKEEKSFR